MQLRLGQVLVDSGLLSGEQVRTILRSQQKSGEPFGSIAERLYGVRPQAIEEAWAVQYATLTRQVDPAAESMDPDALECVTRRQAWQFRVLPIRFDGDELMLATTSNHLRRALRFATRVLGMPVYFVMADQTALGKALLKHYPLPGMTVQSVNDDGLDLLLQRPA